MRTFLAAFTLGSSLRFAVCCATLSLAAAGCQQSATNPVSILQELDPQLIVERGQLRFVSDAATGCALARQRGLPCLLFFTAEWCTFCHQMEETAFTDATIGKMAKQFVCVLVDADREAELCGKYNINGFPTLQFLAADGRKLHRLVGRQSTPQLTAGMQAALSRLAWLDHTERR
ncbi:MAG: thioredoxin family protein [Bythopirellula sp.]